MPDETDDRDSTLTPISNLLSPPENPPSTPAETRFTPTNRKLLPWMVFARKRVPANSKIWQQDNKNQSTYQVPVVIDDHAFYKFCRSYIGEDGERWSAQKVLGVCRCCAGARYVKGSRSGRVVPCPLDCWR